MIKLKSQTSDHSETPCSDQEEPESIGNLIKNEVIPQWNQYMSIKNLRKEADPSIKPRADTFKKKILRDLREFYRILFRKRFHLSEYKTIEGISKCVRTFFSELTLTPSPEDLSDFHLFRFLHQTHKTTCSKITPHLVTSNTSSFLAVEKFNNSRYISFLSHSLSSQMLTLIYRTYLKDYTPFIKSGIRKKVVSLLAEILDQKSV
ncbi:unnamed protein product [Moneuplotes crassus]|uniref:Uncharacterized protein n=1 Tax=Euplotes crassus TaxID=5936 RepID=A0AAD1XCU5_EUPCR|nr:unnamed protein product [Moneuplotes crassus]